MWSSKFQSQIKNTLVLTGLFNYYLNDEENKNDLETYFHSLSTFMFTQNNLAQLEHMSKLPKTTKYENKILIDSYLASISFILVEQSRVQCYTLFSPNKNDLKSMQFNRSCSALNYYNDEKKTDQTQPFSQYKGYELNTQVDELINCSNWFKNLKLVYEKAKKSMSARLISSSDYINLLQNFVSDPSSLWCGPFYECESKNESKNRKNEWVLKYSLPLIDLKLNLIGSVSVKFKLGQLDLNQCPTGDPIVANTHKCKANSECVYVSTNKFLFGSYKCKCTNGFIVNGAPLVYNGTELEAQYWLMKNKINNSYQDNYDCVPCSGQKCCSNEYMSSTHYTKIDTNILKDYENRMDLFWPCRTYNMTIRILILSVQIVSILFVLWLAVFIFYKRQNKVILVKIKELIHLKYFIYIRSSNIQCGSYVK